MVLKRACKAMPLLLLLLALSVTTAGAQVPDRKIVVFRPDADEVTKDSAIRQAGGNPLKSLRLVNAAAAELTPAGAQALLNHPKVLRIESDSVVYADAVATPTTTAKPGDSGTEMVAKRGSQSLPWGIQRIRAPQAWEKSRGANVKVAVLDSGIDLQHPDLRVSGGVNLVQPRKSYDDDSGHGTHVAGIIAALDNTVGVAGVGPKIDLYAVKVLDKKGRGWHSDIIAGLDWAVEKGMQVANMSFGGSEYNQAYHEAIIRARSAGLIVVASAGNLGPTPDSVHYPARYPEVVAVSAIDVTDAIAPWSSIGPQIAVTAPGLDIFSTYTSPRYTTLSGTSMAAPHVTGAIALRLKVDPSKSPDHIISVLKATASKLPGLTTDQQGAGLVNALRLVSAD